MLALALANDDTEAPSHQLAQPSEVARNIGVHQATCARNQDIRRASRQDLSQHLPVQQVPHAGRSARPRMGLSAKMMSDEPLHRGWGQPVAQHTSIAAQQGAGSVQADLPMNADSMTIDELAAEPGGRSGEQQPAA